MSRGSASGCGMSSGHRKIFFQVARALKVWILVRATNPESLKFIGSDYPDIVPKPLQCKPKTAECGPHAGLVVCPHLLANAFSPARLDKAINTWDSWARNWLTERMKASLNSKPDPTQPIDFMKRLYPGISTIGLPTGFGIVEDQRHMRYGCLVLLNGGRVNYIHGDYDLYDVVDPANPLDIERFFRSVNGSQSAYGRKTGEVQRLLNQQLGADMVQHGEDLGWYGSHSDDMILAFSPDTPGDSGLVIIHSFGQGTRSIERIFKEVFSGRSPGGSRQR